MDTLMKYHSLDIQWGNHDILWIGAYLGNLACIANVIRINCSYKNLVALPPLTLENYMVVFNKFLIKKSEQKRHKYY